LTFFIDIPSKKWLKSLSESNPNPTDLFQSKENAGLVFKSDRSCVLKYLPSGKRLISVGHDSRPAIGKNGSNPNPQVKSLGQPRDVNRNGSRRVYGLFRIET
jgi:hypothetical protein